MACSRKNNVSQSRAAKELVELGEIYLKVEKTPVPQAGGNPTRPAKLSLPPGSDMLTAPLRAESQSFSTSWTIQQQVRCRYRQENCLQLEISSAPSKDAGSEPGGVGAGVEPQHPGVKVGELVQDHHHGNKKPYLKTTNQTKTKRRLRWRQALKPRPAACGV